MMTLPYLTAYDPPGASEGSLDPLGLYQIADQLASRLVPAVRERMQRVRFLTAMAVGAMVTQQIEEDPTRTDVTPSLAWEWLVVEALVRTMGDDGVWGVPGTLVARRAIGQQGYLDLRSYLKTPRIFGFHGVYKRLAIHIGVVDVHLGSGRWCGELVDQWARDAGLGGADGGECCALLETWRKGVKKCLGRSPARTCPGWVDEEWRKVATLLAPHKARAGERRWLRDRLLSADGESLGALPQIWALQGEFPGESYTEEALHNRLRQVAPAYTLLLDAIRAYEVFCRGLQDAFDLMRAAAQDSGVQGYSVSMVEQLDPFKRIAAGSADRYKRASDRLGEVSLQLREVFDGRFKPFAEPMTATVFAQALCDHHERVQKGKSADGKRPWFDRLGPDRIFIRHPYRIEKAPDPELGFKYVHEYRAWPIRRFYNDLQ